MAKNFKTGIGSVTNTVRDTNRRAESKDYASGSLKQSSLNPFEERAGLSAKIGDYQPVAPGAAAGWSNAAANHPRRVVAKGASRMTAQSARKSLPEEDEGLEGKGGDTAASVENEDRKQAAGAQAPLRLEQQQMSETQRLSLRLSNLKAIAPEYFAPIGLNPSMMPQLLAVDLRNNRLTSLPEQICT